MSGARGVLPECPLHLLRLATKVFPHENCFPFPNRELYGTANIIEVGSGQTWQFSTPFSTTGQVSNHEAEGINNE